MPGILKRLTTLLLVLMLALPAAGAEPLAAAVEESAPLTYEEMEIYLAFLGQSAREDGERFLSKGPGDVTVVNYAGAALEIADEDLMDSTAVLGAVLTPIQADLRGLYIGDSLTDLLRAYPNDNPNLYGTYYDATLYIYGEKPEITLGYLLRDGQRVVSAVHCVYHWTQDGVVFAGVEYTLHQGIITGISLFGMANTETEKKALEEIADVAGLQEITEYFAYPQSTYGLDLAPFDRDDLSFAGVDFLDLTPEMAEGAFGKAALDQWIEDSTGELLRQQQWYGLTIVFLYDAQKQFQRVDSLIVSQDVLEGPRGVRVDDWMDSVVYRFRHGEGGVVEGGIVLYGSVGEAPYGLLTYDAEGAAARYALSLPDGRQVLWLVSFVDAQLYDMRLVLRDTAD